MTAQLLDALTGLAGVTITVRHELAPASARLMASLGVRVLVDPAAPACVTRSPNGRSICPRCAAVDRKPDRTAA